MTKQVLVIHGGTTWSTYEEYFKYLQEYPLERLLEKREKGWKDTLQDELGEKYEVIKPSMPSPKNARYKEWKLWLEKYFPILRGNIILIGHSLGGAFILKYLSEEGFSVDISQLHLVATPVADTEEESLCEFKLDNFESDTPIEIDLSKAEIGKIFIYHSTDDEVVPFSDGEKCHKVLPQSEFITFKDRGHFIMEEFPELLDKVRSL